MSTSNNLTFESDNFRYKSRSILGQAETPKMVKYLLNKKIVKNEKQAQNILITITILFLLASIYVFAVFVFDVQLFNQTPQLTEGQIQQRQEAKDRFEKLRQERQNSTINTQNPQ